MPASQSRGRAPSQPATAALVRSATTSSSRPPSRSTRPVTYRVGARRVALRKLVSSSPSAATSSRRMGSSTSWVPWSSTARMMVAHPTPRSRATAATAWASLPTRRHASARARSVSTARGRITTVRLLGPGPNPAGWLTTAPDPLAPGQHHRPAADRQVTHPDRAPAVRSGRHATTPTADHRGHGLDDQLPFAIYQLGRDELEAVQAEQPGGGGTTVVTHLGPPSCQGSGVLVKLSGW